MMKILVDEMPKDKYHCPWCKDESTMDYDKYTCLWAHGDHRCMGPEECPYFAQGVVVTKTEEGIGNGENN